MKRIGPTRLILLNCGKFDYAELNLDAPLHLVGPNNIGKTSLIAVMQYLYIDNQKKMKFSSDHATTRKYYFPDVSSFALFESLGPEGFMLTGVRGLGPIKQYEIERFSYQGRFDRNDYLSPDNTILPWDQIKINLASKNYTNLRPTDLRAALMGNEGRKKRNENNSVNLSLVPLRRKNEYDRFCSVFLNLLRLSHLRQDELKELLLQLFDGEFTKRRIDLQDQFAPQLEQLQFQKADVYDLKRNETAICRILEGVAKRNQLRGKLKASYAHIGKAFHAYKIETENLQQDIEIELQKCQHLAVENKNNRRELEEQRDEKNKEQGSLLQKQEDLQKLEEQFSQFNLEWTNENIRKLEDSVRNIDSNLDMAQDGTPESIRRRLGEAKIELTKLTAQLKNIDSTFITSLMKHLNQQQIDKLSRIFNDDILRLSASGDDAEVTISNRELLHEYVNQILEGFAGNKYTNEALSLDLSNVHHFDIDEYVDPERIRQKITHYEKDVIKTKAALHAAENRQELKQKRENLREQFNSLLRKRAKYQNFLTDKAINSDLPKLLKSVGVELAKLHEQLESILSEQTRILQKEEELGGKQNSLFHHFEQIDQKILSLYKPQDEWEAIEDEVKKTSLEDMLESYCYLSNEHQQLADRIEGELETIHSQTYDRYQADTEKESLVILHNELETLDEKQKALEENWASFTVQLKKDFRELNRDMDKLYAKVNKLNGDLAKVHISNLSNLKINIVTRAELKRYFNQVEDNEQTPLFADPSQTDEAIRKISRILQEKPVISLEDMFDMHFEITTPNGEMKKYNHLDRIESNGTTITIKVLINLILLRGLLSNENVYVPFYLDECSSLDSENLSSIVEQARQQGFIAILASPEAMDAADHLYYLSENNGRVTLNPQNSLVEIVRDNARGNS